VSGERRPLRIGIDARDLLVTQRTGVERVVWQLVDSLGRVGDPGHEYVFFFHDDPPADGMPAFPGEVVVEPVRHRLMQRVADAWLTLQMRKCVAKHRLDAFYTPNSKLPFAPTVRITTVHGLEWDACPGDYRKTELIKQRAWFRLATRHSAGIVTFARATHDGMRRLRPDCRIPMCVTPEGVDPAFHRLDPDASTDDVLARHGIDGPFVLSVCSLEPRKNLDALVRAFAIAVREHDVPHALVLVGRAGRRSARVRELVDQSDLGERVCLPGYVSDEDLVALYNRADLFVYPSKYEGFGLPVIEAMACGAPVVTSERGSLIEVGGDAARLVDPDDDRSIATAIGEILASPEDRAAMREAGLRHAAGYSWDAMTRSIVAFIDERVRAHDDASPARAEAV
jgi:glycosyltransferase involved in cell wall biosynthesis